MDLAKDNILITLIGLVSTHNDESQHILQESCYLEHEFMENLTKTTFPFENFISTIDTFENEFLLHLALGRVDHRVLDIARKSLYRVSIISKVFQDYSNNSPISHNNTPYKSNIDVNENNNTPKFYNCQDYFRRHLHRPYPDHKQKSHLASLDHATISQVEQWFCNRRKRSKWNELSSIVDNEKKYKASELIAKVSNGVPVNLDDLQRKKITEYIDSNADQKKIKPSKWLKDAVITMSNDFPFLQSKRSLLEEDEVIHKKPKFY